MSIDFPQKDKKRAERRKAKALRYKQAKEVAHNMWPGFPHDEEWEEQWAKRHADNMKACSCWMCGNPRKQFHKETLQEKKFKETPWCD